MTLSFSIFSITSSLLRESMSPCSCCLACCCYLMLVLSSSMSMSFSRSSGESDCMESLQTDLSRMIVLSRYFSLTKDSFFLHSSSSLFHLAISADDYFSLASESLRTSDSSSWSVHRAACTLLFDAFRLHSAVEFSLSKLVF